MSMKRQVDDIISISDRLLKLLEKENEALRSGKSDDVAALLHEKNVLTRAYEVRVQGFSEASELLAGIDANLRRKLLDISDRVNTLVEKNVHYLRAGMEASRFVVKAVIEAAQEHKPGPGTYSANGEIGSGGAGAKAKPLALTVNQSL